MREFIFLSEECRFIGSFYVIDSNIKSDIEVIIDRTRVETDGIVSYCSFAAKKVLVLNHANNTFNKYSLGSKVTRKLIVLRL